MSGSKASGQLLLTLPEVGKAPSLQAFCWAKTVTVEQASLHCLTKGEHRFKGQTQGQAEAEKEEAQPEWGPVNKDSG